MFADGQSMVAELVHFHTLVARMVVVDLHTVLKSLGMGHCQLESRT